MDTQINSGRRGHLLGPEAFADALVLEFEQAAAPRRRGQRRRQLHLPRPAGAGSDEPREAGQLGGREEKKAQRWMDGWMEGGRDGQIER